MANRPHANASVPVRATKALFQAGEDGIYAMLLVLRQLLEGSPPRKAG